MGRITIGKNARGLRMGNVQGWGRVRIGNIYGDHGMGDVDIASGAIDADIGNVDGNGEAEIGNIYRRKPDIESALRSLEQALGDSSKVVGVDVAAVRRKIAEARAELASPQPQPSNLRTYLTDTATLIQTSGALATIYSTFRAIIGP